MSIHPEAQCRYKASGMCIILSVRTGLLHNGICTKTCVLRLLPLHPNKHTVWYSGAFSNAWRALEELGVADDVRKGHLSQERCEARVSQTLQLHSACTDVLLGYATCCRYADDTGHALAMASHRHGYVMRRLLSSGGQDYFACCDIASPSWCRVNFADSHEVVYRTFKIKELPPPEGLKDNELRCVAVSFSHCPVLPGCSVI